MVENKSEKDLEKHVKELIKGNYSIGDKLKVDLIGVWYIHPKDSFTGSEAALSLNLRSNEPGWLGVSSIYATYAGVRNNVLKLRLEMLEDITNKKVLAISAYQISDINKY